MTQGSGYRVLGKNAPRMDAWEKVTGRALFAGDVKRPGMLYAKVLWPEYAHARIISVDTSRAEALPGVRAVATARDVPDVVLTGLLGSSGMRLFASPKVRHKGDVIAAVAAETEEAAEEAVRQIKAEYEPLPILLDPEEAMKLDAPWVSEGPIDQARSGYRGEAKNVCAYQRIRWGDVEKGFAQAALVYEDVYETQKVHQGYLEPQGAIAEVDPSGRLTIWMGTQVPFNVQSGIAELLRLPISRVRVINTHSGGGFGGRFGVGFAAIPAFLALKTGRPVRLMFTREEDFIATFPRHPFRLYIKIGVGRDGAILAFKARTIIDTGAYPGEYGPMMVGRAAILLANLYKKENGEIEAFSVLTNQHNCGPYRAPASPQVSFAVESHLDTIAEKLGMDAVELRLRNCWEEGDIGPTGQALKGFGGMKEVIRRAARAIGWGEEELGPGQGIGLALGLWATAGFMGSSATLKLNDDGTVTLVTGASETGSGSVFGGIRLIVAEELGLSPEAVRISWGDTDFAPWDGGSVGSRTTFTAGNAALRAAQDMKRQLLALASAQLRLPPEGLEMRDGVIRVAAEPSRSATFAALARASRSMGGPVVGKGSFAGSIPSYDPKRVEGVPGYPVMAEPIPSAHAVKVEVDRDTGRVSLLKYVAAQDVGIAINPQGLTGQVEGGVAQGIGMALLEELKGGPQGDTLNPSFLDYRMPTAADVPPIETIVVEGFTGEGPYGAKGAGEPSAIPPPAAIASAIYRATGVRMKKLPLTAERVWRALQGRKPKAGEGQTSR